MKTQCTVLPAQKRRNLLLAARPQFRHPLLETDEYLSIQHIGQIDSGVEQMAGIGDTDVKFELITD